MATRFLRSRVSEHHLHQRGSVWHLAEAEWWFVGRWAGCAWEMLTLLRGAFMVACFSARWLVG